MRTVSFCLAAAGAVLLLSSAGQTNAASGTITNAYVNRVAISGDQRWGGCIAQLSISPQTILPGCGAGWVTFSCSGDFADQVRAYRMVDQAQLALATSKKVIVYFQDDKKHNGYCFANRLDVLR
jgi:hypothetical protein